MKKLEKLIFRGFRMQIHVRYIVRALTFHALNLIPLAPL